MIDSFYGLDGFLLSLFYYSLFVDELLRYFSGRKFDL